MNIRERTLVTTATRCPRSATTSTSSASRRRPIPRKKSTWSRSARRTCRPIRRPATAAPSRAGSRTRSPASRPPTGACPRTTTSTGGATRTTSPATSSSSAVAWPAPASKARASTASRRII
uniref:(northern house mosquito) hypothetical protein n=1 Tax=Culex pipiens TaxID=7175 RepID=A0A8D8AFJ1_CULPI